MKERITKILYQNSTDDSECMRIKFEKIPFIIDEIEKSTVQKKNDDRKVLVNRLSSEIESFLYEHDKSVVLECFNIFLCAANVDTDLVIEVLEKFGPEGKEIALGIKIREGY